MQAVEKLISDAGEEFLAVETWPRVSDRMSSRFNIFLLEQLRNLHSAREGTERMSVWRSLRGNKICPNIFEATKTWTSNPSRSPSIQALSRRPFSTCKRHEMQLHLQKEAIRCRIQSLAVSRKRRFSTS